MSIFPSLCALVFVLSSLSVAQTTVTLRVAGDEWFLKSLTKTELIPEFERKTGVHVDLISKNEGAIISDLDRSAGANDSLYDVIVVRHRKGSAAN